MSRILHQIRIGKKRYGALPLFPHFAVPGKITSSRELYDPQRIALTPPDRWVAAQSDWMDWWNQY